MQKRTGQDDAGKTRTEQYRTLMRVLDGLKREKDSIVKGEDRQDTYIFGPGIIRNQIIQFSF